MHRAIFTTLFIAGALSVSAATSESFNIPITIQAVTSGEVPRNGPLSVRMPDRSKSSLDLRTIIVEELRRKGYQDEEGAPVILGIAWSGAFDSGMKASDLDRRSDSGRSERAHEPVITVPITKKRAGDTKGRAYRLEASVTGPKGRLLWRGQSRTRTSERDQKRIMKALVASLIADIGESVP